jgi:predicted AAA+ superfamily ATPase
MYYRDTDKAEVNFVIENTKGDIVGVEVEASATVTDKNLKGLKKLVGLAGKRFKTGLLLYDGTKTMPLGENILATSLWGK